MNYCEDCKGPLKLLQLSLASQGIPAPSLQSAEIRGCKACDITYYFGATRHNQQEHWMRTPYKFNDFRRSTEDWDISASEDWAKLK